MASTLSLSTTSNASWIADLTIEAFYPADGETSRRLTTLVPAG